MAKVWLKYHFLKNNRYVAITAQKEGKTRCSQQAIKKSHLFEGLLCSFSTRQSVKVGGPSAKLNNLSQSITDRLTFVDRLADRGKIISEYASNFITYDFLRKL